MLFWMIVKVAFKSLLANKLRSVLAMLGIIIGVGAVIAMVAIGEGTQQRMLSRIQAMGTNLLIIRPTERGSGGVMSGTQQDLTPEDALALLQLPDIHAVSPVCARGVLVKYMTQNTDTDVRGIATSYLTIRDCEIDQGKAFTDDDVEQWSNVALLGSQTATTLFGASDPVGEMVKIKSVNFRVVGVLKTKGDQGFFNPDDEVFVPYTTAMHTVHGMDYITEIDVEARDGADLYKVQADVTELIRRRHNLEPGTPDDIWVRNQAQILDTMGQFVNGFRILLGSVAGIALLIGGIGIMNIMLVTVTERTREIGIRKAIGARGFDILSQFVIEAILMSGVGGLIGVLMGYVSSMLIGRLTQYTTIVEPLTVIGAFALSAIVALVFGIYPAYRASKLDPIERFAMNEHNPWILRFRGALAAIVLLAGGCVDQKKEVAIYRKIIDNNQPPAIKIDPTGPLSLGDALRLANENEEQLSIQGESYLEALIAKDKAFSAFLPTVSLGPSYSFDFTEGAGSNGQSGHSYSVPLSGGMNVFNGFRDYYTQKADTETIEQQKQLVLDLQQTVLLDVVTTYYQILTSEESVRVLKVTMDSENENLNDINAKWKVGAAVQADIAQAQAQLAQTLVNLNQAAADVRNGRTMLAFLLDEPVEQCALRDDFNPPAEMLADTLDQWQQEAAMKRQDLAAAEAAVRSARYAVQVAVGEYYPSVSVNLTYDLYSTGTPAFTLWNGAVSANIPIFTAGQIEADVRDAWSRFRSLALNESQLRRQIVQSVETAVTNLNLAHQQLSELVVEVQAAQAAYDQVLAQYRSGANTELNVLTADSTLESAKLQLATETYLQKTTYLNLLRAVGSMSLGVADATTRPTTMPATLPTTQP